MSKVKKSIVIWIAVVLVLVFAFLFFHVYNLSLKNKVNRLMTIKLDGAENIERIVNKSELWSDKSIVLKKVLTIDDACLKEGQALYRPTAITTDSMGNIFIMDIDAGTVLKFNQTGEYITEFAGKGRGPKEIWHGGSMEIFASKLLILDSGNNKLNSYTLKGEYLSTVTLTPPIGRFSTGFAIIDSTTCAISYWDRETEKAIHCYDLTTGKRLRSFGHFVSLAQITPAIEHILRNFTQGFLSYRATYLFFSRLNPYEICIFHKDLPVKLIYRENKYMPPPDITAKNNSVTFRAPSTISYMGCSDDFLIQCISVVGREDKTILDVLNLQGQWLKSIHFKKSVRFRYIDKDNYLYAIEENDEGYEINKYKLVLRNLKKTKGGSL